MGRVHSIDTMGALDGPGIRMVVFFQGCKLRCMYCHNPDTWSINSGIEVSAKDIVAKALKLKPYFEQNNGGITFSGGEPLLQPKFLLECLKLCKEYGINTTLDTSGVGLGDYSEILKYTDLVILDIKHENPKLFKLITGTSIEEFNRFKAAVIMGNKKLWIKHVVIPDVTDTIDHIKNLAKEINSYNGALVEKVELLPYHTLGTYKYKRLNIPYRLKGTPDMCGKRLKELDFFLKSLLVNSTFTVN